MAHSLHMSSFFPQVLLGVLPTKVLQAIMGCVIVNRLVAFGMLLYVNLLSGVQFLIGN